MVKERAREIAAERESSERGIKAKRLVSNESTAGGPVAFAAGVVVSCACEYRRWLHLGLG